MSDSAKGRFKAGQGTKRVKVGWRFCFGKGGLGNIPLLDEIYEERQDTKEVALEGKQPSGQVQKPGAEAGWVCLRKSQEARVSEAHRAGVSDVRTEGNDG